MHENSKATQAGNNQASGLSADQESDNRGTASAQTEASAPKPLTREERQQYNRRMKEELETRRLEVELVKLDRDEVVFTAERQVGLIKLAQMNYAMSQRAPGEEKEPERTDEQSQPEPAPVT